MCAKEVETEQVSVRVQEADETDYPKISSGLSDLPTWMDRDSSRKSLVREKRRSITQVHLFCYKAQVSTKNITMLVIKMKTTRQQLWRRKIQRARGEPSF